MFKKTSTIRKFFNLFIIFISMILLVSLTFFIIFFNELITMISLDTIKLKDENGSYVYEATVHGDFYLPIFGETTGAKSSEELASFLKDKVKIGFTLPDTYVPTNAVNSSSAFTFTGSDIPNKFFTKNYVSEANSLLLLSTKKSPTKHATITTVDLSMLGLKQNENLSFKSSLYTVAAAYYPIDGINDVGVSASIQYMEGTNTPINVTDTDKKNVTETIMLRLILDYANNIEAALELISNYDLFSGSNIPFSIFIADKSGKSAIVSLEGSTLKTYYNDNKDNSEESIMIIGKESNETLNDFQYISNFSLNGDYSSSSKLDIDVYKNIENTINPNDNYQGIFGVSDALNLCKLNSNVVDTSLRHNYTVIYNMDLFTSSYYFHSDFEKQHLYKL